LNVSFKISTKVISILDGVADKVINITRTAAFMSSRYIIEVVSLHESLHKLLREKKLNVLNQIGF
jgi:hypothetical protein